MQKEHTKTRIYIHVKTAWIDVSFREKKKKVKTHIHIYVYMSYVSLSSPFKYS